MYTEIVDLLKNITVDDVDIFRNERLGYAGKLVFQSSFTYIPGFDFIARNATVSKRAMADYVRGIQSA